MTYNETTDIRVIKSGIRADIRQIRRDLDEKEKKRLDKKLTNRLLNMWSFREAKILFCFYPLEIEIDTLQIMENALRQGKKVALPKCAEDEIKIDFYLIDSLDDVKKGKYGIYEPEPIPGKLISDFSTGLCIVPALAFDREGYRLGFGKGYYDRFLLAFGGETIGLSYDRCLLDKLPNGKYDKKVMKIITESKVINILN